MVSELSNGLVDGHVVGQDTVVEDEFDGVRLDQLLRRILMSATAAATAGCRRGSSRSGGCVLVLMRGG